MVILHTWLPLEPQLIFEGYRPDAGHSSMEVVGSNQEALAYISYWPEPESLIGHVTQLIKPRPQRYPATYAQETDPDIGYMQRPSDYSDEITGLDEDTIVELWSAIGDTHYDLLHWNCSNVCKLLILSAFDTTHRDHLMAITGLTPDDLASISGTEDQLERLRYLATSQFIDCRPEDVRRMVEAYHNIEQTLLGKEVEQIKSTPA